MDDTSEQHKREALHEVAQHRLRDEDGHFIKSDDGSSPHNQQPPAPQHSQPLNEFFNKEVAVGETKDDKTLLDVHVGNPLRRITELLEEIKKQKAFSFTLKGSLGAAGVVLVLATFGIFGSNQLLCDKGIRTKVGTLTVLDYQNEPPKRTLLTDLGLWYTSIRTGIPFAELEQDRKNSRRVILSDANDNVLEVLFSIPVDPLQIMGQTVYLTGNYNACDETMTVKDKSGVEEYR